MGSHPLPYLESRPYYLILATAFLLLLAAMGGASRPDELQQSFVCLAAIVTIAAALWPLDLSVYRAGAVLLSGLGLLYLLLILQLVPLPATLWASMPGHDIYARLAQQTHSLAWRSWTLSPDLTLNALAGLLPATAVLLVTLALDFSQRLWLAQLVLAIACFSAFLGLLQFASGGTTMHLFRLSSEDAAVGLFANRNHEAALIACSLPILAAITSIRVRKEERGATRCRILAACTALLMFMGLAATGSRMGLLLGLVGLAAGTTIYVATSPITKARRAWSGGLAFAIVAAVPVVLLVGRSGSAARLASDPLDQTRIAALAPMLEAARAFFPFGAGFGTFQSVYQRFEPDFLLKTIYLNQAHDEPLQLVIEGGLPVLVILLLFFVWWVRAAVAAVRPRQSVSRRSLAMAMTAATLIIMLSSLVDYPLRTPLLSALFALACVELVRSNLRRQLSPRS